MTEVSCMKMNFELFSKRTNPPHYNIYTFDKLPNKLRVQILYSWKRFFNTDRYEFYDFNIQYQIFEIIEETICREHGLLKLASGHNPLERCNNFVLNEDEVLKVLDIIELSVKVFKIFEESKPYDLKNGGIHYKSIDLIEEINKRFKENGIGYEIIGEQFIKKDEEFIYENSTKPAIALLVEVGFKGAEEEFFEAYEHYKNGKNKDAIASAAKSFESTLKSICNRKGWTFQGKGTASSLINCISSNNLIPNYMQTHLTALRTTLEGLPTLRNNNGGHGQGELTSEVPDYLVDYALNLCATNIVFLVNAYKTVKC